MATVSTYLNLPGNTEEAFLFYRSVFGTEFDEPGFMRMDQGPSAPGRPPLSAEDRGKVMHVSLPLLGGHRLMGSDATESMGYKVRPGNNLYIMLQPDTRGEADRLFSALSAGGSVEMPMSEMFWGDYFGSFTDRFGVYWMINTPSRN